MNAGGQDMEAGDILLMVTLLILLLVSIYGIARPVLVALGT